MKHNRQKSRTISGIARYLLLLVPIIISLFPIYWMINTSFKNSSEIYKRVPTFFPENFTISGYTDLFAKTTYLTGIFNSLFISFTVATITLVVALPCSYAIARIKFKGSRTLSKSILFAYLIPAAVMYLPLFIVVSQLNLSNTLWGLILIYPTLTLPYAAWILIPYLSSISKEMEAAAIVDGCTRFSAMYRIIFPLSLPGIVTTFIFSFTMCWGEYLYALVNISSTKIKTYPLILSGLIYGDMYPWGELMAGGIIACIPICLIFTLASKYLIGGLTAGSVKE